MFASKSGVSIYIAQKSNFRTKKTEKKSEISNYQGKDKVLLQQQINTAKEEIYTNKGIPYNLRSENVNSIGKNRFSESAITTKKKIDKQLPSCRKDSAERIYPSIKEDLVGVPTRRRPLKEAVSPKELHQSLTRGFIEEKYVYILEPNLPTKSTASQNESVGFNKYIYLGNNTKINTDRNFEFGVNKNFGDNANSPAKKIVESNDQLNKQNESPITDQFNELIYSPKIKEKNGENMNVDMTMRKEQSNFNQLIKDCQNKSTFVSANMKKTNERHTQYTINKNEVRRLYEGTNSFNKYDESIHITSNINCGKMTQEEIIGFQFEGQRNDYSVLEKNMEINDSADENRVKQKELVPTYLKSSNLNSTNSDFNRAIIHNSTPSVIIPDNFNVRNLEKKYSIASFSLNIDQNTKMNLRENKALRLLRNRRAVSESNETDSNIQLDSPKYRRSARARSVPSSDILVASIKKKNTCAETASSKHNFTLDAIEETNTSTLDSPSNCTRSKKRLYLSKNELEQKTNKNNEAIHIMQEKNYSKSENHTARNTTLDNLTSRRMTRYQMAIIQKVSSSLEIEDQMFTRSFVNEKGQAKFESESETECISINKMKSIQPKRRPESVKVEDEMSSIVCSTMSSIKSNKQRKNPISKESHN